MSDETHRFSCKMTWTGAAAGGTKDYATYSREVRVDIDGKPSLTMSSAPAFVGDPKVHNPEDLLMAALSSCHFLTYAALCSRSGIEMVGYEDEASGVMEKVDRTPSGTTQRGIVKFTSAVLHPKVVLAAGTPPEKVDLAKRLHAKAHTHCFIACSVNFPVTNEPEISVRGA